MRVGVLRFPGSNCDHDCAEALSRHFGIEARFVWHEERALPPLDMVVIPGGFSFGDYLRSGALAAHSPIMAEVSEFTERGGAVFG
ncbi:MAG: phosphoribosylformylglycinamidine synthase subunit PurQ, partial [Proteobacteria bacterium]|nr:phosphoribosylformylglycinamidine synthase subunit PurQ [Pseudomonadota bacterium]